MPKKGTFFGTPRGDFSVITSISSISFVITNLWLVYFMTTDLKQCQKCGRVLLFRLKIDRLEVQFRVSRPCQFANKQ